jgi:hypothetical protein
MKTFLIVNLRVPGFHRWEDAPDKFSYLSNFHRHEFHICCEVEVEENRRYEVISLKDMIHSWLLESLGTYNYAASDLFALGLPLSTEGYILLDKKISQTSVEGLGEFIATYLREEIEDAGMISVTVLEDGENGARIEI